MQLIERAARLSRKIQASGQHERTQPERGRRGKQRGLKHREIHRADIRGITISFWPPDLSPVVIPLRRDSRPWYAPIIFRFRSFAR